MIKYIKENPLGCLGSFLVLLGYYFNANEASVCWLIWIIGNSLVALYSIRKEAYSVAVMSFCIVAMNIYGYFKWL
tara:strand:- start:271 stop:495 length:225 start_codon:yes stop_codon:yes gene_type:complete